MKRMISLLLTLVMLSALLPVITFAADVVANVSATSAFCWNFTTNARHGNLPTSASWGDYRGVFMSFEIPQSIMAYKDKEIIVTATLSANMTFNNGRKSGQAPFVTIIEADGDVIDSVNMSGGSATSNSLKSAWANGRVLGTIDTLTEDVSTVMYLTDFVKEGKNKIGLYLTCRNEDGYFISDGIVNFNSPVLTVTATEITADYYLDAIKIPYALYDGYELPKEILGQTITWSDEVIEAADETVYKTITATVNGKTKGIDIMIMGNNNNYIAAYTTDEAIVGGSMHLAVKTESGWEKLNFGLGVLYASADLDDGTVAGTTKILEKPYIYRKDSGRIGVAARSMTKEGVKDDFLTLWETDNLVDYTIVGTADSVEGYELTEREDSETLDGTITCVFPVTDEEREYLVKKLCEVKNTSVEPITVRTTVGERVTELPNLTANYTDGSTGEVPVKWNMDELNEIDFSRAGLYTVTGQAAVTDYESPMISGTADPVIINYNDKYYFIATNEAGGQVDLYIRCSDTIEGLMTAQAVKIFTHTASGDHSGCNWAPELHVINGELYCLFASSTTGKWNGVQARIMKCVGDPMNVNDWEAPVRVTKEDGSYLIDEGITLDMTYFEANGKHYYCWAERAITSKGNGNSQLVIATMDPSDPYRITSEKVIIRVPDYAWDRRTSTIDEGPYVLKHNGKLYMTFSGSGVDNTYAVGLLTADENADLLNPKSWKVTGYPVLESVHVTGEYGPGHNAFTKDEYGRDIIVFHMKPNGGTRSSTARVVHYAFDGTPIFYMTAERYLKSEYRDVTAKIYVRDDSMTDEEFELYCIADSIKIENADEVRGNIKLPTEIDGAKITWSSDSDAVTDSGKVKQGNDDIVVKLTALIEKNNLTISREFEITVKAKEEDYAYLFAYFTGNNADQERLFYGVSLDGYNFRALNGGRSVLTSDLGTGCIRDPFIMKGEDGYYYILATDMKSSLGWSSNYATVVYKTPDLINIVDKEWINYREIKGAENCTRAWAPQAIWCPEKNAYMVYITMSIPQDPYATVMYRHYATDLCDASTYTELELMLDEPVAGAAAIDGDIIYDKFHNEYIMYYDGKRVARADTLSGEWTHAETKYEDGQVPMYTAGGVNMSVEGSCIWKLIDEEKWIIAADGTPFNGGCYAMVETTDFENYTQLWEKDGEYSFDFTPRHGYVIPISKRELDNLFEKYGEVQLPSKEKVRFKDEKTAYFYCDHEAYAIVAAYDETGALQNVWREKIAGEKEIAFIPPEKGTVSIMMWNEKLEPLTQRIEKSYE